jgi:hypothetical protein
MFDNIPIAEKKLQWIENTTARWDGYMEFQRRPQPMLDWLRPARPSDRLPVGKGSPIRTGPTTGATFAQCI